MLPVQPNHSMHQTLPLRGTAGDFESWAAWAYDIMDSELPLRIVVEKPPRGVIFWLQRGGSGLVEPTSVSSDTIVFDFTVRVGKSRPDGFPNALGEFAQGTPADRFVYINSGTLAGQPDSCWSRRAKVRVADIFRWHDEEMKKFQGTWKQIAYERDGVTEPLDEQGWEPRVTFTGDTCVVTLADGRIPIKGTYKLDPTRDPKTVDWTDPSAMTPGRPCWPFTLWRRTGWSFVPRTRDRRVRRSSGRGRGKSSASVSARSRRRITKIDVRQRRVSRKHPPSLDPARLRPPDPSPSGLQP